MKAVFRVEFPKGYIAHPYWPEREKLINVQKESGINRARSEANRGRALQDYLHAHNMTVEDYEVLGRRADRQFYTWNDVLLPEEMDGLDPEGIVVPAHHLYGCLAQAASLASTSVRLTKPEQLRTVLTIGDLPTGKTAPDGVWERFVVVTAGAGNRLSNQRALRSNAYLGPFKAEGWVRFSEQIVSPEKVRDFLTFAGREIGVGASRKLGWGRFALLTFEEQA